MEKKKFSGVDFCRWRTERLVGVGKGWMGRQERKGEREREREREND